MRKRPCLLFACIFLTGIVFQKYGWKVLCLVPVAMILSELYHGRKSLMNDGLGCSEEKSCYVRRIAGRSLVLLSAFFLGMIHTQHEMQFRDTYMSKLKDDSDAVIYGEIIKSEKTDYGNRLILTDCYVSLKEEIVPCNDVMVYASSDQFQIGQIYQIKGQVNIFEHARNEGNFDSAVFYQSQKIDFAIYASESKLLDSNENRFRDSIFELKNALEEVYREMLNEDAAAFYMGMMLGDKSLISEETKNLFAVGGISHILAISGLHMSIIGRGFYRQLRRRSIGFLPAGILAGILVVLYCYMVGNGTSAIRAVGMLLLSFLAQYWGRSYDMLNALGTVAIYLLWRNPFLIDYSGFQFSIAALIGVGFVGKTLASIMKREEKKIGILSSFASSLWMSMGITLSTLPIMASCYYEVPLYSTLVNSIALPILTPVFVLALAGALIGIWFPWIGYVLLIPCGWLFAFYEFLCSFVKELPFGSIITGKPQMEMIVVYYVMLVLGCVYLKYALGSDTDHKLNVADEKESIKGVWRYTMKKLVFIGICVAIILWPKGASSEIVFLDVGQGDGIFIGAEDGTTLFIDGGSSDVNQVGTYRILPFLKAHGIRKIDYWFVSHADTDHMSGLLEVMEDGYPIGCLVISDKMPEDESREALLSAAEQAGIEVLYFSEGDRIQTSGFVAGEHKWFSEESVVVTYLYPWAARADRNEQSMVLLVDFYEEEGQRYFRSLFSGDISSEGEEELIKRDIPEVDLYKAAHHGSKYSNSVEFLEYIQPKYCVISCGVNNRYGHPHVETLERLEYISCETYSVTQGGQITVEIGLGCTKLVSLVK